MLTANIVGCITLIVKKRSAFKVGDVVELKSGSPRMSVTEIAAAQRLRCSWFVGGNHKSALFPFQTLKVPDADVKKAEINTWLESARSEALAEKALMAQNLRFKKKIASLEAKVTTLQNREARAHSG